GGATYCRRPPAALSVSYVCFLAVSCLALQAGAGWLEAECCEMGPLPGRLQMGLRRLAQRHLDGLNERGQAERFFQPSTHRSATVCSSSVFFSVTMTIGRAGLRAPTGPR